MNNEALPAPPRGIPLPAASDPPPTAPDVPLDTALSRLALRYGGADLVLKAAQALWGARGKVGRNHPETSKAAARLSFGSQRFAVLSAVAQAGNTGATAADIAPSVKRSRNQTATRLMELRELGLVTYGVDPDTGKRLRRATGPDSFGLVQFITPLGRQALMKAARPDNRDKKAGN